VTLKVSYIKIKLPWAAAQRTRPLSHPDTLQLHRQNALDFATRKSYSARQSSYL
jgi:hypothetical protein